MSPSDLNGPGKYDDITTFVREFTKARAVALIVFDGNKGPGFSVQCPASVIDQLPGVLEDLAKSIRAKRFEEA